ncbi:hypothetical protein ILYODFUR_024862 [Ilyodon furcidens]|uniref:Uncharacterized protein n=1 Tax=Ilyodon furcidens TaxID=33524 RepID=A0ABV0UKE5_9TELE
MEEVLEIKRRILLLMERSGRFLELSASFTGGTHGPMKPSHTLCGHVPHPGGPHSGRNPVRLDSHSRWTNEFRVCSGQRGSDALLVVCACTSHCLLLRIDN